MPLPSCQSAGGKYQLLSKTTVKDEYLLTDRQLTAAQGGLGCLAVPNPNNPKHGEMKLYMRAQVEALALSTWHSEEALFDVKEKRREERLRKAEVKRKSKEERQAAESGRGPKRARASAEETAAVLARLAPAMHEHVYVREEHDEATDTWTRYCECGYSESYEQM